ncbi:recombinase family protein [Acrocarpospora sp. B8E8]|uniref:recombinase family protein n=1 Tax=Acrocarpospora sp. B8E8 TaxID=3153572 RepID=UPI00325C8499
MTTRAAIYTRVSQDIRGGRSVAEQEAECRVQVSRESWDLAGVWSDNDRSASKYAKQARKDWELLLDEIRGGNIDVLVVWDPSRATRDRLVWAALAAICEEQGVKIAASGRVYDLADPDDAFQLDLFFSLGVRESGVTRKRVLRTVRANAATGRPHGRQLFGYRRLYHETTREFVSQVIDPEQAATIREMAKRVLAGESLYMVADWLNSQDKPTGTGGQWIPGQVKRTLLNPGYIGMRVHQGKIVGKAVWPAILKKKTHSALVAKLTDPARGYLRDSRAKYLLTGIALCACGTPLRVLPNRGSLSYVCMPHLRKKGIAKGVGHPCRLVARVDAFAEDLIIDRLSRPDAVELHARNEADLNTVYRLADEIAEKRRNLETFYEQAAKGDLSAVGLAWVEKPALAEIERLEGQMNRVRLAPQLGDLINSDPAVVRAEWRRLDLAQQREVVKHLMVLQLLPVGRGRRNYTDWESVAVTWRGQDIPAP